jgi:hypothetical protein
MEYDLDTGAHSVHSLHYHLILASKYRRGVLTEERTQFNSFAGSSRGSRTSMVSD